MTLNWHTFDNLAPRTAVCWQSSAEVGAKFGVEQLPDARLICAELSFLFIIHYLYTFDLGHNQLQEGRAGQAGALHLWARELLGALGTL